MGTLKGRKDNDANLRESVALVGVVEREDSRKVLVLWPGLVDNRPETVGGRGGNVVADLAHQIVDRVEQRERQVGKRLGVRLDAVDEWGRMFGGLPMLANGLSIMTLTDGLTSNISRATTSFSSCRCS